jgi:hypothetical protein
LGHIVQGVDLVIRGCAIPVAWKVVDATHKGAWKPHWEALLVTLYQSDSKFATMTMDVCSAARQNRSYSFGFLQDQHQIGIKRHSAR